MIRKPYVLIGVMVLASLPLVMVGQDVKVTATVDQTQITLSDQIIYQVKVSGASQNLPSPTLPEFTDFRILRGPDVSTSIVQTMGQLEVGKTYTFYLQPKQLGEFTIPPAEVKSQGKTFQSEAITIQVIKESTESVPASLSEENISSARTNNTEINRQLRGRLFVRAVVDNEQPYVGEQFTVSYYLYNDRIPLGNLGLAGPQPEYQDFIAEPLYTPRSLNYKPVTVDGKQYQVALLKKLALVPTKAGSVTLEPPTYSCNIRVESSRRRSREPWDGFLRDDFFSSFFDRNVVPATMAAAPIEIEVKPLPEPKPAGFSGTVGQYTMNSEVDRTEATEDELVTLRLSFSGTGYVESIVKPELEGIEGFELYESKASCSSRIQGDQLAGEKEFEFVLRPLHPGTLNIPSIRYVIFNPEKESYETLETKEIALSISPGEKKKPLVVAAPSPGAAPGEGKIIQLGEEINYIKTQGFSPHVNIRPLYQQPLFMVIQLLPLLGMGIAAAVHRRREVLSADARRARRLQARGVAARRLKAAQRALSQGAGERFVNELPRALRGYLADKLGMSAEGLTVETVIEELEKRKVAKELQQKTKEILSHCDLLRYAGIAAEDQQMENLYQQSTALIQELEKMLKK